MRKKILLLILSTILSLASSTVSTEVSAQTKSIHYDYFNKQSQADIKTFNQQKLGRLTEEKWQVLAQRFYQSRYRAKFTPNNSFLSLREVRSILGFSGIRNKINNNKINKHSSHQYWYWQDAEDPNKRITAVFIYHQLIGLRSRGFDRQQLKQLKTTIINQALNERLK